MSLQKHSFTELTSPSARYLDGFLSYNQSRVYFEQGFSFNFIDALSSVNDAKINNYSSMYLTDLVADTSIFSTNLLEPLLKNVVTYVAILSNTTDLYYLNFSNINSLSVSGTSELSPSYANSYAFTLCAEELNVASLYFELELVTEKVCRIRHTRDNINYYLCHDRLSPYTSQFFFTTAIDIEQLPTGYNSSYIDGFDYILDESGYLYLTKWSGGNYYVVNVENGNLQLTLLTSNLVLESTNCVFRVLVTDTSILPKLNSSWISYTPDNIDELVINRNRSIAGLKNNSILHFEYENITNLSAVDVNTIKLKNSYTDKNISKRGNCLVDSTLNIPVPFFREYTNIYTGGNQEAGYRNLTLNYVFNNYDLKFDAGTRTEFTTPSSMYPYDQINVNDTNFLADGSMGFNTPVLSDRITTKNSLNTQDVYGSYLTTWLSGNTWVDRYYFPDIITRQSALSNIGRFEPTFRNVVSELAYASKDKVQRAQYFDVKSDLAFYPAETYYYERVGNNTISNYVANIPNLVQNGFVRSITNDNLVITTPVSSILFNSDIYSVVNVETINNTGSFTVFFSIANTFDTKFGYMMGNLIEDGFAVYNDSAITPLIYIRNGKFLNAYNTDSSLIYTLSFDNVVTDVIDPGGLNDFHAVAGGSVYNIATDGTILAKVDVAGLSGYLDCHHAGETIYFLKSDSKTYIEYNTTSNLYLTGNVTIFSPNETTPVGIFYHKGTVFGFESKKLKKDAQNYLYGIFSDDVILRYMLDEPFENSTVFARSNSVIRDIGIDRENNVYMLHNNYELTRVDSNRRFLNNLSFVDLLTCYSIDFVNEYRGGSNLFYPIVLATDANRNVYTIKDINFQNNLNVTTLIENVSSNFEDQTLTGFNNFIDNKDYESLNFEIKLSNIFNYLDKDDIKFSIPISNLSRFENTFCFSYSNDGVASLYLNGVLIDSKVVDQYKYIGNVFARDNILVGSTPFHNNTTLSDFLGIANYGKLNNTRMYNFNVYNRGLNDTEIKTLYLSVNGGVETLYTSLPCGQRNNIEEIQGMFKFSQPISKSNAVDIIIKNTNIDDVQLQNQLTTNIISEIGSILPGDVVVRDVNFINY